MLRAIVTRKLVVPEIYDLMDKVSKIMVTSQSPQVQELCRGVLLQFLLDYPQGKGRLRNHMTLLAKNLSYVYESGRKSVMELLGAIIAKFQVDLVREYSDLLFVALVMVIANDDSPKCCEMAAELIKSLFARLADAQRNIIMSHVHLWAIQQAQPQLARVSLQVCGIIVDLMGKDVGPYVSSILEDLNGALEYSAQILESDAIEVEKDLAEQDVEWQISYHALLVFAKLLRVIPDLTVQQDKVDWPVVVEHLVYPHAWTRTASCRILGLLFAATPVAAPNPKLPDNSPFSRVGMEDVTKKLCLQLRSPNLDAALSLQIVKNLFYIGKCFCTLDAPLHKQELSGSEEEEADREDESEAEGDAEQYPLAWLLSKLSYQARHALVARRNKPSSPENWIHQPTSVLKWFAAMVSHMDASQTEHFLMHILSPVYRITEDDTIRDPQFGELKTLAVELQDLVQNKVGTTKFADVYNRIRQTVLGAEQVSERPGLGLIMSTIRAESDVTSGHEAQVPRALRRAYSSEKLLATWVLVQPASADNRNKHKKRPRYSLAYRASQRFAPFYRHVCLLLKLNSEECKKADALAVEEEFAGVLAVHAALPTASKYIRLACDALAAVYRETLHIDVWARLTTYTWGLSLISLTDELSAKCALDDSQKVQSIYSICTALYEGSSFAFPERRIAKRRKPGAREWREEGNMGQEVSVQSSLALVYANTLAGPERSYIYWRRHASLEKERQESASKRNTSPPGGRRGLYEWLCYRGRAVGHAKTTSVLLTLPLECSNENAQEVSVRSSDLARLKRFSWRVAASSVSAQSLDHRDMSGENLAWRSTTRVELELPMSHQEKGVQATQTLDMTSCTFRYGQVDRDLQRQNGTEVLLEQWVVIYYNKGLRPPATRAPELASSFLTMCCDLGSSDRGNLN
ncbi:predicted protein [Postia placenta Mad-698-R]|nr:predicted protein [Postia placenta Mad-698-R]